MARPLLGWGPGNFELALKSHVDPAFYRIESQEYDQTTNFKHVVIAFDDPHNKVVGELATKGALGLSPTWFSGGRWCGPSSAGVVRLGRGF